MKLFASISGSLVIALFAAAALFGLPSPVEASHAWGNYHWARTANPFTVKLGNNLSGSWPSFLNTTSADWTVSDVLDTTVVTGAGGKNCRATSGRVEVCNRKYGNNGWLGIAQIWINGDHITQGTVKVNDTYFTTPSYNTTAWKNLVMCQEVGHTFGLDHQDETFDNANLETCMDYTNNPATNQHPNAHDYDELRTIYAHFDTFTTVSQSAAQLAANNRTVPDTDGGDVNDDPGSWGRSIRDNGHVAVFERDTGNGRKVLTHVIWAE